MDLFRGNNYNSYCENNYGIVSLSNEDLNSFINTLGKDDYTYIVLMHILGTAKRTYYVCMHVRIYTQ